MTSGLPIAEARARGYRDPPDLGDHDVDLDPLERAAVLFGLLRWNTPGEAVSMLENRQPDALKSWLALGPGDRRLHRERVAQILAAYAGLDA